LLSAVRIQWQLLSRSSIRFFINLGFHLFKSIQHIILKLIIFFDLFSRLVYKHPLFGTIKQLLLLFKVLLELLLVLKILLCFFIGFFEFVANRTPFPKNAFIIDIEFMAFFTLNLENWVYWAKNLATLIFHMFLYFLDQNLTFATFVFHQLIKLQSKRMFEPTFDFDILIPTVNISQILHDFPLVLLAMVLQLLLNTIMLIVLIISVVRIESMRIQIKSV